MKMSYQNVRVILCCMWIVCTNSLTDLTDSRCPDSKLNVGQKEEKPVSREVFHLFGVLGWSSVIVLHDTLSEQIVKDIVFTSGDNLQKVRFLTYNIESYLMMSGVEALLQSVHLELFPRLNFLLIGQVQLILNVMSKVASHDAAFNRTTDFRHSSRWVLLTHTTNHLIEELHRVVDDRLDHLVIMCSSVLDATVCGNDCHSILTWSRSISPPNFVKVRLSPSSGNLKDTLDSIYPNIKYGFNNRTFIVSTLMYAPFTIERKEGDRVIHEGYCFEILNLFAQALNFSAELISPPDMEWGLEKNGKWTGLVGQLQYRNVDMVVAPLSMHEDRAQVMDFVLPAFHFENVDILCRFESDDHQDAAVLIKPFKQQVLFCTAAILIGVVLVVVLFERLTGDEANIVKNSTLSQREHRASLANYVLEHLSQTFWRMFGTLLRQDISWKPVSFSTRVLMTSWCVLTMVLGAGYSAYLVASLAVELRTKPFKTLQDVVDSTDYKLGIMSTGIIKLIFQKSRRDDFKQAFDKVTFINQTDPGVFAKTETEHVQKVLGGKYCWIVDVTTAEKSLSLTCDLDTVGVRLNEQQLSIGLPINSTIKPVLENAMSSIADSGLFQKWWRKWQKYRPPEMCPHRSSIHSISMRVLIGPVYVAAAGIGAAGLVLLLEVIKHRTFRHTDIHGQHDDHR